MKRKILTSVCTIIVTPREQRAPAIPASPASRFSPRLRSKTARRCVMGGALLLGQVLTVAPADAKPGEGTSTRVSAPAHPQRSRALVRGLAVSLAAGPTFARAKARYESPAFGEGPSFHSHSTVAPGAAVTLTLGGRVGSRLLVGGAVTISRVVFPSRFSGETKVQAAFGVGPELVLLPNPRGGVFAYARGGLGWLNALVWSAAAGGGYALPLGSRALVGLGIELSGAYSRFGREGEFSIRTWKDQILAPALVARLML
jgi:hypothetical protein